MIKCYPIYKDSASECNESLFSDCRAQPVFYKDSASECNENLFSDCRVQPVFYKDSASECNESLFSDCRVLPVFYKDTKSCTPFASFSGRKYKRAFLFMFFKKKNKRVPALSMQWEHASFMLSNVDFWHIPQFRSIIPCEVLLYIEVTFFGFIH